MRTIKVGRFRAGRPGYRLRALLAAAMLAAPLAASPVAQASPTDPGGGSPSPTAAVAAIAAAERTVPRFPWCSWWTETTAQTTNVALPDTSAAYWTTPFFATPGTTIQLNGTYADARFSSVTVYDNSGGVFTDNGVISSLLDYQIAPDHGTVNPYQQTTDAPGTFTVSIQRHVQSGQPNVPPMVPSRPSRGTLLPPGFGFIVYRVYLPHTGSFDSIPLPSVTLTRPGGAQTLRRCPQPGTPGSVFPLERALSRQLQHLLAAKASTRPPVVAPTSTLSAFVRPKADTTNAFFPNPANAYLAATFPATPGTVVVVQGKAATATAGSSAQPWPDPAYQMRYWSMCNNVNASPFPVVAVPDGDSVIYGCTPDDQTALVDGRYTFVLSTLSDRPPNATPANGMTWLPYSPSASGTTDQDVLLLRNMLAASSFPYSVQQVPQDGTAASASAVMGDYYPQIAQCPLATFTQGGVDACFAVGAARTAG